MMDDLPELRRRYYRWWTVGAWRTDGDTSVKLGPVSFIRYPYRGKACYAMSVLCRWIVFDTGITKMRKGL